MATIFLNTIKKREGFLSIKRARRHVRYGQAFDRQGTAALLVTLKKL